MPVNIEDGKLIWDGKHGSTWFSDKKYQVWNPWTCQWDAIDFISYFGQEFIIGPVSTTDLSKVKIREAVN
jgi:hypothetical protein